MSTEQWPSSGIRVNPGRGATRLGDDAIPVHVDVPRWMATGVRQAFETRGIVFTVQEGFVHVLGDPKSDEPTDYTDRFFFPGVADANTHGEARRQAAALIQRVIDAVPGEPPNGS